MALYHGLAGELPVGLARRNIRSVVSVHDLSFLRLRRYHNPIERTLRRLKLLHTLHLADRIVAAFPEIDRTWLLTGVGCMLKSEIQDNVLIPYYPMEAESYLPNFSQYDNKGHAHLPFACNCDIAIRSLSRAMAEPQCAATELFLKRVEVEDMVQGNEYVVITNKDVLWRKIRTVANDDTQWRLVARNREEYDDINIRKDDIKEAWRVIAKMAIMAS